MDLRQLRYLMAIASEGSFNRASNALRVAQPALSRQIRQLEIELGSDIFVRSAAGVKLTPAGEVLHAEAKRLLPQFDLAGTRFRRAAAGQLGVVQVALSHSGAHIRRVIAAFARVRAKMTEVEFRLNLIESDAPPEMVMSGQIDVGVFFSFAPLPTNLKIADLKSQRLRLLVLAGHVLCRQSNVHLADLNKYDLVFPPYAQDSELHDHLMSACLKGGLTPRIALEAFDIRLISNLVRENVALGFCIPMAVEELLGSELTTLEVEDLRLHRHIGVAWNPDQETPAITRFVDHLRRSLAEAG